MVSTITKASRNYILHGHNMKDGYYAIFSVITFSQAQGDPDYFAIRQPDFATEDAFLQYASEAKARFLVVIPVDIAPGDRLLTLLTCDLQIDKDDRFAVLARRLRPGEVPADFQNSFPEIQRDLYCRKGSSLIVGKDVLAVQQALSALGYLRTECDGVYGESTTQAASDFQAADGLTPDGVVGEKTRLLLGS